MDRPSQTDEPTRAEAERGQAAIKDIVCAVDGSRGAGEAVREAIALSGSDGSLTFLSVAYSQGAGLAAQAELGEERATAALEEAARLAREAGVDASTELRRGMSASHLLIEEAEAHDLLVLGSHGGSRLGGIMAGSTATQVAHRAEGPVLVAREAPSEGDFPLRILLATDGSPGSWSAARTALRLARARGSTLHLAYVPDGLHPERYRKVLKQIAMIEQASGERPPVADDPGDPADLICEAARAEAASLIVVGRRGLSGVRALGSVSERVVHEAPCSVLMVPPGDRPEG